MKNLFFLFALCFLLPLSAQENATYSPQNEYLESPQTAREIEEIKWKKATKGLAYNPPKQRKRRNITSNKLPAGSARTALIIGGILLIAVILVLSIAAWGGYLKNKPKKINKMGVSIQNIEENIFESDLQNLLQQAIDHGEYSLAIRLYFLEILKTLALQKKIKWKKEKTNRIYFFELSNSGLSAEFNRLAVIFDRIRYGGSPVNQNDFSLMEPDFKTFLKQIKIPSNK